MAVGLELKCEPEEAKKVIYETIDKVSPELREISLDLHNNPETSMNEHHASQVLADYVEKKGFKVTRKVFGMETSFRAEFGDETNGGRRIGFCSEYDALPGLGHACGHNLIAISGVASALAVKALLESGKASGKVILYGTPSEELLSGKIVMMNHGAFKDIDVCLMLHPANAHANYVSFSALQDVKVEYRGKPAHAGGAPWNGSVNALDAICQAWVSIGLLRQQLQSHDRVHGIITDGGKAPNIIPDYTAGHFYVRSNSAVRVEEIKEKVDNCFRAAALATGTQVTMKWRDIGTCKNIVQNPVLAETYAKYLKEFGHEVPSRQIQEATLFCFLLDFGNVSYTMPGLHPLYSIGVSDFPHTAGFANATCTEEAHKATIEAAKSLSMVAAHTLLDKSFYESSKQEFEDNVPVNMRKNY
ncbi:hypothetical protein BDB00DRAFT_966707 [Zychaea mexicana]|uniref:uncharacterized protein n=1 Tax=Zychaea mexicana TaxID=64656 RepID=UPI0022FE4BB7|nr:uncharacterized protein BDB00DRAFT_966707 [Zychaea mexicana]KAI9468686.1 hypothetical protein BDB00DRAFT_966707 [Zychaea mexicana]